MKTSTALFASAVVLGSTSQLACKGASNDRTAQTGESVTVAAARDDNDNRSAASSPFIVGEWKFMPTDAGTPAFDTEFRFINPTNETVFLEYAFFEPDGTFCGCDRDILPPNKTTIYTVLGESQTASPGPNPPPNIPFQFSCQPFTSGALKAFVFKSRGQHIFLDDTTQAGFQTHAFGGIMETPDGVGNFNLLTGTVMTEAEMTGISVSDSTRDDIRSIHTQCLAVQGPLPPLP
jgi:hypothetical protein